MHKILFFFILLFVSQFGKSQTKFYATISAKEVAKDDFFQLKLIVENANTINKVSNPMLKDFSIESGPNEETSVSSINGKVKKYIALTYILKPKAVGNFVIPSVSAMADGKEYKSESLTIKVVDKPVAANQNQTSVFDKAEPPKNITDFVIKDGQNIADKVKGNMFVKVIVDKKSAYVGEAVGVTYKLYTRLKSESIISKNPSFNGFSVVDMSPVNGIDFGIEKINGKEYNVSILRKVQLFPLQSGVLSIEKIEVDNLVTFIKENFLKQWKENFFEDFEETPLPQEAIVAQKISLQSDVVNIDVKPLPNNNIPKGFKTAVGDYKINTTLEKENFAANETNKLIVTISGQGNLHLINMPVIDLDKNFDVFEPVVTEKIEIDKIPQYGTKTFTIPFVISDTGIFKIDTCSLAFFNPKTMQYKRAYSLPITIKLSKKIDRQNFSKVDKPVTNFFTSLQSRKWIVGILIFVVVLGIFLWSKNDLKNKSKSLKDTTTVITNIEEDMSENENWLAKAEQCLINDSEANFYKTLNIDFVTFLAKKCNIDAGLINKSTIEERLKAQNFSEYLVAEIIIFLKAIDDKLYNPLAANTSTKEDFFNKAKSIINQVE